MNIVDNELRASGDDARPAEARLDETRLDDGDALRLPIVEEQLVVGKRTVETGRVRVHVAVDELEERVTADLARERVSVERVPVGEFVSVAPEVRAEGDVTVVPVLEERLVVEKRLFLVEELRLRRVSEVEHVDLPVTRRVTRVDVEQERFDQQGESNG